MSLNDTSGRGRPTAPARATERLKLLPQSAEAALARAQWQPILYAETLSRAKLLALQPSWRVRSFRLQVIRNQPFEFVASVLRPFLAYSGLSPAITYSDYDDSLAVAADTEADIVLVWLDFERYRGLTGEALEDWLTERLERLRHNTAAPILVANRPAGSDEAATFNRYLDRLGPRLAGVYIADQAALAREIGPGFEEPRTAALTGTRMSDLAALSTARQLGLCLLPALLLPPVKAVVVDLDETLYGGVLGEDGPASIRLSPAHMALQHHLLSLRDAGIYLAAVSRNLESDVESLFARRTDLPIRREDFSATSIGWGSKSQAVINVATRLRIGSNGILFIDDNPGELASVASALPEIRTLHAAGPEMTLRALRASPGLYRWAQTAADAVRVRDQGAIEARERILEATEDSAAYLAALQVQIRISVDQVADVPRLHELSQKTNQFNTALLRLTAAEVARYQLEPDRHAVAIGLRDRLADSGTVGALFIRLEGDRATVDEIAISCRALGRGLERIMILAGLEKALAGRAVSAVDFNFKAGPRNEPARRCLGELSGDPQGDRIDWHPSEVRRELSTAPIIWGEA